MMDDAHFPRSAAPEAETSGLPFAPSSDEVAEAEAVLMSSKPYCKGCPWRSACRKDECGVWRREQPARAILRARDAAGVLLQPTIAL